MSDKVAWTDVTWLTAGKLKELIKSVDDDSDVVLLTDGGVKKVSDIALLESRYEDHKALAFYSGYEMIENVSMGFLKEVLWGVSRKEKKDDRSQKS